MQVGTVPHVVARPDLAAKAKEARRPNVILIVADDQGFGDVGFNGNKAIRTPVLDALSRRGVTLDQFHVSPVCAPSRASILTGRASLRTGVWSVTRGGEAMRPSEVTMAEAFAANGYATAAFGKWHNGAHFPSDPVGQGFQTFDGFVDGHLNYWNPALVRGERRYVARGYLTDILADRAVRYVEQSGDKPYFLYVPLPAPHSPYEAKPNLLGRYKTAGLDDATASIYALVEDFDHNVGRILNAVRAKGQQDDTIVVYLSDNGPVYPDKKQRYNAGLTGSKGSVDEGGTRVPFVMCWPGHLAGGTRIATPAQHIDIYPTLMELAGITPPPGPAIDGKSLVPMLTGRSAGGDWDTRYLFTHQLRNTRRPDEVAIQSSPGAVRQGRWLATFTPDAGWALYDVIADPSQALNASSKDPARLAAMKAAYLAWYADASSGASAVQPVQLGLPGHEMTELPANEASLYGSGIHYHGDWGWAHDWVDRWTDTSASMRWLVRVSRPGRYRVSVSYATAGGTTGPRMVASFANASASAILPLAPPSTASWGRRTYPTDEVPERRWARGELGYLDLPTATAWLSLHSVGLPAGQVGDVKAIRLIREPDR
ncbi:arylsulfatase [Sphingomonas sp. LR60]|uniref:arylsulfatase n=1 Tax=Sphingomonas sp. LR60 TaxID=3050233 RepID=UPI002FDF5DFD